MFSVQQYMKREGDVEGSKSENERRPPHLCKNNFIPARTIPGDDKLDPLYCGFMRAHGAIKGNKMRIVGSDNAKGLHAKQRP